MWAWILHDLQEKDKDDSYIQHTNNKHLSINQKNSCYLRNWPLNCITNTSFSILSPPVKRKTDPTPRLIPMTAPRVWLDNVLYYREWGHHWRTDFLQSEHFQTHWWDLQTTAICLHQSRLAAHVWRPAHVTLCHIHWDETSASPTNPNLTDDAVTFCLIRVNIISHRISQRMFITVYV